MLINYFKTACGIETLPQLLEHKSVIILYTFPVYCAQNQMLELVAYRTDECAERFSSESHMAYKLADHGWDIKGDKNTVLLFCLKGVVTGS